METSKELPKGQEHRGCAYMRGDLLQVPRTMFTHFGIYLGDGRVAHFLPDILPLLTNDRRLLTSVVTNTRLILGCMARKGTVRVDRLEDFVYGAPVVRVNVLDAEEGSLEGLSSLPPEEVAQRAEHYLGDLVYSLLWNNCEHFVTYCRYGAARSLQTDKLPPGFASSPERGPERGLEPTSTLCICLDLPALPSAWTFSSFQPFLPAIPYSCESVCLSGVVSKTV
uniref:lecithin retinol acyltransferase n=1 Tax=Myxine glutinosa TaxID=7769 RepID=UPI00358FC22D